MIAERHLIARYAEEAAVMMTDSIAPLLGGGSHATSVVLSAVATDVHGTTLSAVLENVVASAPYAAETSSEAAVVALVDAAVDGIKR